MKLKKLHIKNIRSYEEQEITFPDGSLLLSGDIGSGKTSILLAIEYALFGLQPGQKGSALLRNKSDEGEVKLQFEINGADITIERKLRRSSKSITNEYSAIIQNGEKLECSTTELKTKILDILGYPSEFIKKHNFLYRYTVYTPQESMKQIILEEPEARLNILRHIFGVEKYKRIRENLTIISAKLREESKFLQGEISSLDAEKNSLVSLKSFLASLNIKISLQENTLKKVVEKRKLIELEAQELEIKIKEKESFEKEIEKISVLLGAKKENSASIEREFAQIEKNIREFSQKFDENELLSAIEAIKSHQKALDDFNRSYMDSHGKIHSIEKSIEALSSERERIFNIQTCPTCLQKVPEAHKYNIINATDSKLSEMKKELSFLAKSKSELLEKIEFEKKEIKKFEEIKLSLEITKSKISMINKSRERLSELEKLKEATQKDISFLAKHIEFLKSEILRFSKYSNLFKLKQDELKEAFKNEKNHEIALAEFKKESQLTDKEILNLEQKISQKESQKAKLSHILELSNWLSTQFINLIDFVERNVMLKLRIEFSKLFEKWFYMLAGESFEVHLDESFTPLIVQKGIEMDYSFLSGGERTSIALAYRLALNQTINSILTTIKTSDVIILDEPTDGFSDAQLDKMGAVFEELTLSQLIIVSHEQKIENFVDNVIKLRKDADVSRLEPLNPAKSLISKGDAVADI